jgi:GNAT superfamily N-acetyltransferase
MSIILKEISWESIYRVWRKFLWPNQNIYIKSISTRLHLGETDEKNSIYNPIFLGCYKADKLVGVNSSHKCRDGSFRSRGLWVDPEHRGEGIGQAILRQTLEFRGNSTFVWSYPRQTSWSTFENVGFILTSDWMPDDSGILRAYCRF